MELKRLQLVAELDEYKTLLNQKLSEMKSVECESEKLSKLLDSLSRERQWLVGQWETSVGILRTRDKEIEDIIQVVFLSFRPQNRQSISLEELLLYIDFHTNMYSGLCVKFQLFACLLPLPRLSWRFSAIAGYISCRTMSMGARFKNCRLSKVNNMAL